MSHSKTNQQGERLPLIRARHVSVSFSVDSKAVEVLDDLNLDVYDGDFLCVVGLSGTGKTTLLRLLAGLILPSAGEICVGSSIVKSPVSECLLLFQDYSRSLLPWRNVIGNVVLGLEARGIARRERLHIAENALNQVGLWNSRSLYPWQLSGGMQQRVALARALACKPRILLMDEPFGSIDAPTRHRLEDEILQIWQDYSLTIVMVTHDLEEAIYLGGDISLLAGAPATIKETIKVPIGFPRSQLLTRQSPEFLEMRFKIYTLLQSYDQVVMGGEKSHAE